MTDPIEFAGDEADADKCDRTNSTPETKRAAFPGGTHILFYVCGDDCQPSSGVKESQKKPILLLEGQKDVDACRLTLARESRHIVASELSGTTSRATVSILYGPALSVNARARFWRPARAKGFCQQGF
jgi:hypothetical protein